jgi:hypothetical protein
VKVTRQIAAEKIADYLHGKLSQAELVDWAERAMMDSDFDEFDTEVLPEIIGRLGLADVGEFGLRWQDCEEFPPAWLSGDGDCLDCVNPAFIDTARLLGATPKQRSNWRLIGRGVGIHWDDVDEDISVRTLLAS